MKRQAQAQAQLRALAAAGELPASQCSQTFLKLIAPLLDGGVVSWKRSGGGRCLAVRDCESLRRFCRQLFPDAAFPENAAGRVIGVARFRDTKTLSDRECEFLSVRVWREEALLKNGQAVGAAAATVAHGVFSFLLQRHCAYELHGTCALVENPAVFEAIEALGLDVGAAIYGQGRLSNRALEWIAGLTSRDFRLLHLPDYDPVGLSEFQRLRARLGDRILLHVPEDLEARFSRFSNPELLKKGNSQAMLAQLRRSEEPVIQRVVGLIDCYNAGLEQEALFLC